MTARARNRCMNARQRELRGCRVVECCTLPGCRTVADRAVLREAGTCVVRVLGAVVCIQVAGYAFLRRCLVNAILVAARARNRCVAAGQGKLRGCRVVECCTLPGRRVVAFGTGLGKLRRFMIRVCSRCIVTQMTGHAFLRRTLVDIVLMAARARNRCVAARQGKLRTGGMIENQSVPPRHAVA